LGNHAWYLKIGLQVAISIVGVKGGHVAVELFEEIVEGISLAKSGVGHIEFSLGLITESSVGGSEKSDEEE
jgi:hypothetical protein